MLAVGSVDPLHGLLDEQRRTQWQGLQPLAPIPEERDGCNGVASGQDRQYGHPPGGQNWLPAAKLLGGLHATNLALEKVLPSATFRTGSPEPAFESGRA